MSIRPGDFFVFCKLADYNPLDAVAWPEWQRRMQATREGINTAFPASTVSTPAAVAAPAVGAAETAAAPAATGLLGRAAASADPSALNAGGRMLSNEALRHLGVGQATDAAQRWGLGGDAESGGGKAPELGTSGELATLGARAVGSVLPGPAGKAVYFAPELGAAGGAAAGRGTSGWDFPGLVSSALGVEAPGTGQAAETGPRGQAMMDQLKTNPEEISRMKQQFSHPGQAQQPPKAAPGPGPHAAVPGTAAPEEGFVDQAGKYHSPAWTIPDGGIHGPATVSQAIAGHTAPAQPAAAAQTAPALPAHAPEVAQKAAPVQQVAHQAPVAATDADRWNAWNSDPLTIKNKAENAANLAHQAPPVGNPGAGKLPAYGHISSPAAPMRAWAANLTDNAGDVAHKPANAPTPLAPGGAPAVQAPAVTATKPELPAKAPEVKPPDEKQVAFKPPKIEPFKPLKPTQPMA